MSAGYPGAKTSPICRGCQKTCPLPDAKFCIHCGMAYACPTCAAVQDRAEKRYVVGLMLLMLLFYLLLLAMPAACNALYRAFA